ncbi:MAG: hypothetical protein IPK10_08080 [Bacteroidetes bacterium]|nr:hypothetical protein [Bacteroidota bacterium]
MNNFNRGISRGNAKFSIAWLFVVLLVFSTARSLYAQTQLINSDFELSDSTNWLFSNNATTNQWVVGSAVASSGTGSVYISEDAGVTNSYNITSATVSHIYTEVNFPAGQNAIVLSFDGKGIDEVSPSGGTTYDYLRISLDSLAPTNGILPSVMNQLPVVFCGQPGFEKTYVNIPASMAGKTMFLVFSFKCDAVIGTPTPGFAIDNILLKAKCLIPCLE